MVLIVADLFKDIIPSILETKKSVLDEEKDYVPFIVNKALSFHYDCVLYANEMNIRPNLDGQLQHDFLLNTVRAYKRPYQKWIKKETLEDIKAVKEYYKYSDAKAQEALSLLSDDQLDEIKKVLDKGGLNARPKRINLGPTE